MGCDKSLTIVFGLCFAIVIMPCLLFIESLLSAFVFGFVLFVMCRIRGCVRIRMRIYITKDVRSRCMVCMCMAVIITRSHSVITRLVTSSRISRIISHTSGVRILWCRTPSRSRRTIMRNNRGMCIRHRMWCSSHYFGLITLCGSSKYWSLYS